MIEEYAKQMSDRFSHVEDYNKIQSIKNAIAYAEWHQQRVLQQRQVHALEAQELSRLNFALAGAEDDYRRGYDEGLEAAASLVQMSAEVGADGIAGIIRAIKSKR